MKALTVLLVVAVAALAWQVNSQKATVADLQKRLDAMRVRLESRPQNANIDLQDKCAKGAREQYRQSGWEKEVAAGFSNHYNEKLNKCFMIIENTDAKTTPGTIWTNKTLVDAFEGKVFANYSWHTEKDKKYWEVPPFQCDVTLPSGEKRVCKSSDEFDDLVKTYME